MPSKEWRWLMRKNGLKKKAGMILTGGLLLSSVLPSMVLTSCNSVIHYGEYRKEYKLAELEQIKENSFLPLNEIPYPDTDLKEGSVSQDYVSALKDFTYQVSKAQDSFSYAPLNLYNVLDTICHGAKEDIQEKLNTLLGLDKEKRLEEYHHLYPLDFYQNDQGILQMFESMYFQNGFEVSPDFLSSLTSRYAEAYQTDLQDEESQKRICSWVDEKTAEKDYVSPRDLGIEKDTCALLLSTLHFEGKWFSKYIHDNTYQENFYTKENEVREIMYMKHTAFGEVYDYGSYYSVYDRYQNGEKIQFLISKDRRENTFDLIKDVNFYKESEDKEELVRDPIVVSLSVPKFDVSASTDFLPVLDKLGLSKLSDETCRPLNSMFTNLMKDDSVYLSMLKQKNRISFTEDGTTFKSLTSGGFGNKSTAYMDTLELRLDHPFVYTVYDRFGLPIYTSRLEDFDRI